MRFLLTTDPGIEDIVVDELREQQPGAGAVVSPYGRPGQVRVEIEAPDVPFRLGTIHHVIEIRREAEAATLEEIRKIVADVAFDELSDAASFRVTSVCAGETGLDRMEIQRAAGGVLWKRYGTQVDLEGFEIHVRVDLYGRWLVVGLQSTRESLGNRIERGRALRSSLKPTIAAAMLRLAGAHRGAGRLVDPMCGAATIPVEAARINPALEVTASDWDEQTVDAARGTLRNHGLDIGVRLFDARSLGGEHEEHYDFIVTDPPYGLRQAKRARLSALYRSLLESFERALVRSGRIVLIVVKYRVFLAALERTGLRVVDRRIVESGAIHPRIFVLERAEREAGKRLPV